MLGRDPTQLEETILPDKKPSPMPSRRQILDFLEDQGKSPQRRDIARAFGLRGAQRAELRHLLNRMEEDGLIERDGGKRHRIQGDLPPVLPVDIMSVDDEGDLLCMPTKWQAGAKPPMIRLSRSAAAKSKPLPGVGDRILARLTPAGDDSYHASIIRVLGASAHRFLGVFRSARFGGVVHPVERRARTKITVDRSESMGAEDGDLVWVETINRRGSASTRGRVREIAGHVDDRNAYSLIALANHGVPIDLPQTVIDDAERACAPALGNRVDLRSTPLITIDPADAKDHDDAVWATPDDDPDNPGGYKLIVAIADVSWFVRPGSSLDKEALKRGNSVYLPDRVVPMLPERLSNDLCSLREGEDRPCLAVEMTISADGHKRKHKFMRAMMRSAAKLSYEDAQSQLDRHDDAAPSDPVLATLSHLSAAFKARWQERAKRAPLDLDLPERKIILDDTGAVIDVIKRDRFDAHRMVEEFMILANVAAAETLEAKRTPQIYRAHDAPDTEKLDATRDYLASLDYSLIKGGSVRPRHFNQLLRIAETRDQKEMISEVILRSQRQAVYSPENLGHFGLNLGRYSHFTSPIRRYADLTIHRALVKACKLGEGGQTPTEAEHLGSIAQDISDLERRAMAAERESKDRYLAGFLQERLGDEFDGRVRGVTRFGLFISLNDTGADGFVPMRALGFERFRFVENDHAVIGETTGGRYFLGQTVRVRLAEATPLTGGLRFDMLSKPFTKDGSNRKRSNGPSSKKKTPRKAKARKKKSAGAKTRSPIKTKKKKPKGNAKSRRD